MDREESARVARQGLPERERRRPGLAECRSASLLVLAPGPGQEQFEPISGQIPVDPYASNASGCSSCLRLALRAQETPTSTRLLMAMSSRFDLLICKFEEV